MWEFQNIPVLVILGLLSNAVGTLLIIYENINLGDDKLKQLSGTYWGHNPSLREYLVKQKKVNFVGIIFIFIGFVLQTISVIFNPMINISLVVLITSILIILLLFIFIRSKIEKDVARDIELMSKEKSIIPTQQTSI